jgi:hypothetical protein
METTLVEIVTAIFFRQENSLLLEQALSSVDEAVELAVRLGCKLKQAKDDGIGSWGLSAIK